MIFISFGLITSNLNKALINKNINTIHKEITNKVLLKLDSYLNIPHTINKLNDAFIRISENQPVNFDLLRKFFYKQMSIFKTVNIIAFGTEEGTYVEAQRMDDGRIRTGFVNNGNLELYTTDLRGQKLKLEKTIIDYDPRLRPWYKASIKSKLPSWSDIYLFSSNNQPAISGSQPYFPVASEFSGVFTTSVTLEGISKFLAKLSISNNSSVLVIEPSGITIATSKKVPLLDSLNHSISASNLKNPIFSAVSKKFSEEIADGKKGIVFGFPLKVNNIKYLVRATSYYGPHGLNWYVLVIIPESDYMSDYQRASIFGIIFLILFLVIIVFTSYLIAGATAKPIVKLSKLISQISWIENTDTEWSIPPKILKRKDEIGLLAKAFSEMEKQLNLTITDLSISQKEYKNLVENINSIVMKIKPDGEISYCNPFGLNFYGYSENELIGSRVQDTVLKTNSEEDFGLLKKIFQHDKRYWNGTNRNITSTGKEVWILWSNSKIYDPDGNVKELLSIGQDFSSRKTAQTKLKDSLKEKNILLKEIHHRVKNNLQIINSLVNLQLSDVPNTKLQNTLETLQSRIQSMALVHEMLYSSDSFSEIDFYDYISQIISTISATFNNPEHPVHILLNGDTFYLDIERATTCGLLINEIIINAFKHAFKGKEYENNSKIDIILHKSISGLVEIIIKDNGIGITALSQSSDTAGMGTLLIDALTDQIGGTIKISKNKGTSISLVFKNS